MQMPATPGPPSTSTRLRLLGPVQLWAGDRQVDLGPARQRTVLAALAVDAGTPVSLDTLIGRVWDDDLRAERVLSALRLPFGRRVLA